MVYRVRVLPIAAAIVVAMLVVGTFAFVVASRAAAGAASHLNTLSGSAGSASQSPGSITLQQPASGEPTPAAPTYTVGVWVTEYGPSVGSTEQVFVRVSNGSNPVSNATVTLSVSWPGGGTSAGPTHTNSYGLASFQIVVGGPPGQPEFVTATASAGRTSFSAQTTFVPAGGSTTGPGKTIASGYQ